MSETTPGQLALDGGGGDADSGRGLTFQALSTPPQHQQPGVPLRAILPPKSALKGHQRSASHGGVASRPTLTGNGGDLRDPRPISDIVAVVIDFRTE